MKETPNERLALDAGMAVLMMCPGETPQATRPLPV